MQTAPFFRRVSIGLPVAVCCLAVLPSVFAWELFSGSSAKSPAGGKTGTGGMQNPGAAAPGRGGPLFGGQEIRWPTMPFTRSKPKEKPAANRAYAGNQQRPMPYAGSQTPSRFAGPMAGAGGQAARAPQRMSYNGPAAGMHPQQAAQPMQRNLGDYAFVPGSRPTMQAQHAQVDQQAHVARTPYSAEQSRTQVVPPQNPARPSANDLGASGDRFASVPARTAPPEVAEQLTATSNTPRTTAAATRTTAAPTAAESAATQAVAAGHAPTSIADRLVAQAHELSGTAETEDDYTRMIDNCRRARSSQPSAETARYASELASWAFNRRGQLRAEAGRPEEALSDFDDAIRADPKRWRPIHNRGMLLAQAGELERAFDDFTRTIQLNPEFAKAHSNRAALLMVAGDVDAALADYRQAIELDPALSVAQRGCGRAYHLMRQLDQALKHYDEAVRLAPQDAYAVASRADLLTDLGRYAEAVAEYERTIELDPNSSHAYSSCAWLLATCPDASVRNSELAIEHAKRAIELTEQRNAVSYDTLAAAQANAGDFSAAIQTVRQAVQLAPPEEREIYEARLVMYQHAKPYRIAPVGEVVQASYQGN